MQKSVVALHIRHKAVGEWSRRRGAWFTGAMAVKTYCRRCFRFRNRSYQGSTSRCRTLRKNDCEAQPVGVSSILRHCTASPSSSGCRYQSRACGKTTPKRWAHGHFPGEGWGKGNFSNWQFRIGWSPYRTWLSAITSEGNIR